MNQKPVLGKGLASLLSGRPPQGTPPEAAAVSTNPATPAPNIPNKDRQMGVSMLAPTDIRVNPYQPRREFDAEKLAELAQSIKENGIIQPLAVRKTAEGFYELIAGERRLRASQMAGLSLVPVVIRKSTDKESLELALIENIQRQELNCVEEAQAYLRLLQEFKLTQEEIAQRVGKDRATVANQLRLLQLSETILEDLKIGRLSQGHGKILLSLESTLERMNLRNLMIEQSMSVRASEKWVAAKKEAKTLKSAGPSIEPALKLRFQTVAQDLTRKLSTKVEVSGTADAGKITVHYHGKQDLDRIIAQLQGSA